MKEQKKKEEAEWDKRKIFLFLILILILSIVGYELKSMILGENINSQSVKKSSAKQDTKGASIQEPLPQNLKRNVSQQINNLKEEAQNINIVDIASSSPQVQKVINDLKALQSYPSTQLKEACEKVCSGL